MPEKITKVFVNKKINLIIIYQITRENIKKL